MIVVFCHCVYVCLTHVKNIHVYKCFSCVYWYNHVNFYFILLICCVILISFNMLNQPGIAIQPFLYVAMLYNPFYMLLDGVCIFVIKEHVERTHEQKPKDRNAGRRWGWVERSWRSNGDNSTWTKVLKMKKCFHLSSWSILACTFLLMSFCDFSIRVTWLYRMNMNISFLCRGGQGWEGCRELVLNL